MLDLEPIKARLTEATPGPWDFCTFKTYPDEYPNDPDAKKEKWIQVHAEDYKWTLGWRTHYDYERLESPGFCDAKLIANAPTDLAALVAEVERLRLEAEIHKAQMLPFLEQIESLKRRHEVDQDQIRSYARALNWYAEPANWVEKIDDRGREKLSFRWADDDGHMARWALSRWQQNEAEKKD